MEWFLPINWGKRYSFIPIFILFCFGEWKLGILLLETTKLKNGIVFPINWARSYPFTHQKKKKKTLSLYPHSFLLVWGMKATNPSLFLENKNNWKKNGMVLPPRRHPLPLFYMLTHSFFFSFFFFFFTLINSIVIMGRRDLNYGFCWKCQEMPVELQNS